MYSYIFDVLPEWLCHEAEDWEDDEPGEDGSQRVGEGEEDGVALAVVVELVVARHRDQPAISGPQWKENLIFLLDNIMNYIGVTVCCLKERRWEFWKTGSM